MPRRLGSFVWQEDVSPADWVVEAVRPWGSGAPATVGSLLPPLFAAYGRLFHPAHRRLDDGTEAPVTWKQVAESNGRQSHPAMEWVAITGSWDYHERETQPSLWDQYPSSGSLPLVEAARLDHTLTASCIISCGTSWISS